MSGHASLPPGLRGCCAAPVSMMSSAMRPRMLRPCLVGVPTLCPTARDPCCQAAAEVLLRLQSYVQRARRQCAVPAPSSLHRGQRCAPGARLAAGRRRERMREAETEGKIKGAARVILPSQSARGLGTAPCWAHAVPYRGRILPAAGVDSVLFPIRCAQARWSGRHGSA